MKKQTETSKPTLKELLLSDSDRFDLEIPARGSLKNRRVEVANLFGEFKAETHDESASERLGNEVLNPHRLN
jgi:hypothetical protein